MKQEAKTKTKKDGNQHHLPEVGDTSSDARRGSIMQRNGNLESVDSSLTLMCFDREVLIEQARMASICCTLATEALVRVHRGPEDKPHDNGQNQSLGRDKTMALRA